MTRTFAPLALLALAACGQQSPPPPQPQATPAPTPTPAVTPIPPGKPGGLPDDRTPLAEGPIDPNSAQGAAQVVQHYYALLESGRSGEARALWSEGSEPGAQAYREIHAEIGAPGRIEGAAGSLYVDVPVQVYGRKADGTAFHESGTITLRRVNDVPGSTPEQRRWHIARAALSPAP